MNQLSVHELTKNIYNFRTHRMYAYEKLNNPVLTEAAIDAITAPHILNSGTSQKHIKALITIDIIAHTSCI